MRMLNENILNKSKIIERNWELQFLGEENSKHLEYWLFEKKIINDIVPEDLITDFYQKFLTKIRLFLVIQLVCY